MVTLQEVNIPKSCLFINLFLKPCCVWKKCTLMCTYSHKLEEMALNLLEKSPFFNILKPPPTLQKADNIRSFPHLIWICCCSPAWTIYLLCGSLIECLFFPRRYFSWKFRRILTYVAKLFICRNHLLLSWQRACVWMRAVLMVWFCVTISKIWKFQQNRWLVNIYAISL